jgi:hypothetical protein
MGHPKLILSACNLLTNIGLRVSFLLNFHPSFPFFLVVIKFLSLPDDMWVLLSGHECSRSYQHKVMIGKGIGGTCVF